jgi:Protein of unknown function (DUF3465).
VRRLCIALAVALVVLACGGRAAPDDQALHQDVVNDTNGAEVTFDATVLTDPTESGGHERFQVKASTGEILEIDHNTSLATYVPAHVGDPVVIHGQSTSTRGRMSACTARMLRRPADVPSRAGSCSGRATTSEI